MSRMAALLLLAVHGGATVVPRLSLRDLARDSEVVVEGRILRHWTDWDSNHQFLWTHYALQVADTLKGSPRSKTVIVSEPGGAVGGISMQIAGVVRFEDGEEVIVFLHPTPLGYWRTYGYGQGKFTVRSSRARGESYVVTNLTGLDLIEAVRPRKTPTDPSSLGKLDGLSLTRFKSLVRELVRQETNRGE